MDAIVVRWWKTQLSLDIKLKIKWHIKKVPIHRCFVKDVIRTWNCFHFFKLTELYHVLISYLLKNYFAKKDNITISFWSRV